MSEDNVAFNMFDAEEDLSSDDEDLQEDLAHHLTWDTSSEEDEDEARFVSDGDDDDSAVPGLAVRPLRVPSDDDSSSSDDDSGYGLLPPPGGFYSSEEDESSEEEDDDDTSNEREIVHWGVSCDECGASPIRGALYHSTRIVDYDICQECYEENHKNLTMASAFAVIKRRRRFNEEDYFGEDYRLMRRDCFEWEDLETELRQNDQVLQNLDVNFNHGLLGQHVFALRPDRPVQISRESMEYVSQTIATSSKLRVIYVELPLAQQEEHQEAIAAFFEGIAASQTIITLCVTMDFRWTPAVQNLCQLIRTNKSIRFLFLRQKYASVTEEERAILRDPQQSADFLQQRQDQIKAAATPFFQALEHSSLHLFMCGGVEKLGEDCRTAAIHAMRTRPCLKRIKASFENETDTTLQDLIDAKQQHWMKDWNDPDASNESRVQILEEIMSCKQVEEQDQVAALFNFVRSNPGALPI